MPPAQKPTGAEGAARALPREQPVTAAAATPTPVNNESAGAGGAEFIAQDLPQDPPGNDDLLLSRQKWNILKCFGNFYLCNGCSIKNFQPLQRCGQRGRSICATRSFLCYLIAKDKKPQNISEIEQKSPVLTRTLSTYGGSWGGGGGSCRAYRAAQ